MHEPATSAGSQFDALCASVAACVACPRVQRSHILTRANGPLDARVMFVAEAPGRRGAVISGVPLSGDEAGRRFEAFLALAGLRREVVFITNAVLCNPVDISGHNRTPLRSEVANCNQHLRGTLEIVAAPLIIALGRVALDAVGAIEMHDVELARDVGRTVEWRGRTLIALYHPGRQSTLHRAHAAQQTDWRSLAIIVGAL